MIKEKKCVIMEKKCVIKEKKSLIKEKKSLIKEKNLRHVPFHHFYIKYINYSVF